MKDLKETPIKELKKYVPVANSIYGDTEYVLDEMCRSCTESCHCDEDIKRNCLLAASQAVMLARIQKKEGGVK